MEIADEDIVIDIEREMKVKSYLLKQNRKDIIDELIRMLPEAKKSSRQEIKGIINQVKVFQHLKDKFSKSGLEHNKDLEENVINQLNEIIIKYQYKLI